MAALAFLVMLLAAGPGSAQVTSFNPEVEAEVTRGNNVLFVPEDADTDDEREDTIYRLRVVLPLVREWNGGSLLFSYTPSYDKYANNDELDTDSHRLDFAVSATPDRRSSLAYSLMFDKTRRQGSAASVISPDLAGTPPTERDLLVTDLMYSREAGRRLSWNLGVGGALYNFKEIEGFDIDTDSFTIEDRDEYRGSFGLHWAQSRAGTLGFEAGYQIFSLEETGDEGIASVLFVWTRTLVRDSELDFRIGGFHRDIDADEPQDNESGLQVQFRLLKNFRRNSLALYAARRPSSGGILGGSSTDTIAQIVFAGDPEANWLWNLTGRYANRDPNTPDLTEVDSLWAAGSLEWRPLRQLGVRLMLDHLSQSSDEDALDNSATTARLGVVWYPKGPR
jgi:hypothetical protein